MLETYIGTKIIQAEPQDCQKNSHNSKVGDPGYKVVYEDGYTSWSPKDVFESAYRKTDGMNFGLALEALRKGNKVRLPHWEDGTCLIMYFYKAVDKTKHTDEVITKASDNGRAIWPPTTQDVLISDRWQIWDENRNHG